MRYVDGMILTLSDVAQSMGVGSGRRKKEGVKNRGVLARYRELKRHAAIARNADTPHTRTKRHRLECANRSAECPVESAMPRKRKRVRHGISTAQ